MYQTITSQANALIEEFLAKTNLSSGMLLVIGCSTSEILGETIGSHSAYEAAEALYQGLYPALRERGIFLAAQCCEHLNRCLVLEQEAANRYGYEPVCVIPKPKAGGSFATACYRNFSHPVVVENISAHAGIDIGGTLIGMHLKAVAVPLRLTQHTVGKASVLCAYSRPKLIGGERAVYHD
ncbi:MAG: TIGR01440 family protein [Clostridia bacterium]|nr:TIGR01440 family protein [Clostridia bacterium]MBO5408806.1 TIGR01440 family protein [Clostridia bacterium]